MLLQNFEVGAIYKELVHKKTGKAVCIKDEIVELQDKQGRPFFSHICMLRYPPVFKSDNHIITLDVNSAKNKSSGILFKIEAQEIIQNIGGADLVLYGNHQGQWRVDVNHRMNTATGSNSRIVGYYDRQAQALEALWDEREQIHISEGLASRMF